VRKLSILRKSLCSIDFTRQWIHVALYKSKKLLSTVPLEYNEFWKILYKLAMTTTQKSYPLNLKVNEIHNIFRQSFSVNLKIMRSLYGLRSLEMLPEQGVRLQMV
jgi:hypothetical protein